MAEAVRIHISSTNPGSIINHKGVFYSTSEIRDVVDNVGKIIQELAIDSDSIRLPLYKEERRTLAEKLVDASLNGKQIKIISPVCPDYGEGELFHSQIGGGIGPEAQAAIKGVMALEDAFKGRLIVPQIEILVADTEGDHPEILKKCTRGDLNLYLNSCKSSVDQIRTQVGYAGVQVSTFTQEYGSSFHSTQYQYEKLIQDGKRLNPILKKEIDEIAAKRTLRHRQILGREEVDAELTIRYMAQYAALGTIARKMDSEVIFLNYDTPNKVYYNAGFYKGIGISEEDKKIIPVLGTVIRR